MTSNNIKQDILNKFRDLAFKQGTRRITLDLLATELYISKKTIYQHFKNKEEIVSIVIENILENIRIQFKQINNKIDDPLLKLNKLFEAPYELLRNISSILILDLRKYYPETETKINELVDEQTELLKETFAQGIKSGIFKNIDPIFLTAYFRGAANSVLNSKFILDSNFTVEETYSNFRTMIMSSLINN